jgi:hypothetical protein
VAVWVADEEEVSEETVSEMREVVKHLTEAGRRDFLAELDREPGRFDQIVRAWYLTLLARSDPHYERNMTADLSADPLH